MQYYPYRDDKMCKKMNRLSHIVYGIRTVMNSSKMEKSFCFANTAVGLAVVFIATALPGCQDKPVPPTAILSLSNSIIVTPQQETGAAAANAENSQIAALPQQPPLNTTSEDSLPQWRTVRMCVTAYCPCKVCCGRLAQGQTANGHVIRPRDRFVAAPKKYSFGTEIIVPQYNRERPIKVLDRGGAITGSRLDIFFPSHVKAAKWGVKYLNVKVRTNRQQET
jgi:3D (Asp-Asp-Asp) domain-containing protein